MCMKKHYGAAGLINYEKTAEILYFECDTYDINYHD